MQKMANATKHVLVYGGSGALGRIIVEAFQAKAWKTTAVDFASNDQANNNITLERGMSGTKQIGTLVNNKLTEILNGEKIDTIINVAGGWAGGNLLDENVYDNVELMMNQSVSSSIITAKLAALHLKQGGLLVLTGAAAATHGTPSMIAYGMAKAAVHHLVKSAAGPDSGLPAGAHVAGILPVTLDTPNNRKYMGGGDTSTWTPMPEIANQLVHWAEGTKAVGSGKLYKIVTEKNVTSYVPVE
ncbi:hypothetical protein HDV04_001531 [Boothiomyces sp. JEL0838]|nr:hypothetical protein HDV04_001531 [Boothiomyces sp. JEL0838]